MARLFDGSNDFVRNDTQPSGLTLPGPITMACWFNPGATGVTYGLISLINTAAGRSSHMEITADGRLRATSRSASTEVTANTVGFGEPQVVANTWQHGAATFIGSPANNATSSRSIILNGGSVYSKQTNNTNLTLSFPYMALNFGSKLIGSTRSQYFNGSMAEVGIWNAELNDDEIKSLWEGCPPTAVRPEKLVAYYPMFNQVYQYKSPTFVGNNINTPLRWDAITDTSTRKESHPGVFH